jgi:hypothetical protein
MTWPGSNEPAVDPAPRRSRREATAAPPRRGADTPQSFSRIVEVRIDPGRVLPIMLGIVALLSAVSFAGQLVQHGLHADFPGLNTWITYSDVDLEGNIPAWFQSTTLLVDAFVLWTVADDSRLRADGWSRHWRMLAIAFGYLSLDELTAIHEQAIVPVQKTLHVSGFFFFAWVLLAIPLVAVFGLMYLRFLRAIPRRTAIGLIGAAALYLGGAVCLEMVGGYLWSTIGADTVLYSTEAAVEEAMEMLGMVTLMITVSQYARSTRPQTGPSQVVAAQVASAPSAPVLPDPPSPSRFTEYDPAGVASTAGPFGPQQPVMNGSATGAWYASGDPLTATVPVVAAPVQLTSGTVKWPVNGYVSNGHAANGYVSNGHAVNGHASNGYYHEVGAYDPNVLAQAGQTGQTELVDGPDRVAAAPTGPQTRPFELRHEDPQPRSW